MTTEKEDFSGKKLVIQLGTFQNERYLKIVHQTERGVKFNGGWGPYEHNGFHIISKNVPETGPDSLYVWGEDESGDERVLRVPSDSWLRKMRAAVKNYNEHSDDMEVEIIE